MKRSGKSLRGEAGQAMVEFALVLPVLILLICGIIDFGWIYGNKLAADNACREAARYVAIHYDSYTAPQLDSATIDAKAIVDKGLAGSYYDAKNPPAVTVTHPDSDSASVKVAFTYSVPFLTGIISSNPVQIPIACTMAIEQ